MFVGVFVCCELVFGWLNKSGKMHKKGILSSRNLPQSTKTGKQGPLTSIISLTPQLTFELLLTRRPPRPVCTPVLGHTHIQQALRLSDGQASPATPPSMAVHAHPAHLAAHPTLLLSQGLLSLSPTALENP